uniref:Uncharacterized protein n=1 Tax=Romanomermis culicivorax TaxID=13658 RepID=A0A915HX41_ROMCU
METSPANTLSFNLKWYQDIRTWDNRPWTLECGRPVGEISPPPEPFMSRPTKMKMQRMMTTMPETLVTLKQANHPPLE